MEISSTERLKQKRRKMIHRRAQLKSLCMVVAVRDCP